MRLNGLIWFGEGFFLFYDGGEREREERKKEREKERNCVVWK